MSKNKSSVSKAMPVKFTIDENHCFHGTGFTVKEVQDAMDAYHRKKKSHNDWLYNDNIPIFVDANVLLNVYFSPVPLRIHLAKFLQNNRSRLFVANQVEKEFMRHRLDFIDRYRSNLTQAAKNFRKACENVSVDFSNLFCQLKDASMNTNFIDSLPVTYEMIRDAEQISDNNHILKEEYNALQDKLKLIKEKFEEEYHELYEKINIEYRDPILNAISQLNILPPLGEKENEFVENLYQKLKIRFDEGKDSESAYLRFPGSGEKSPEEKLEPWGDLVIYHQLLVYMAEHKNDIIFLTNDKSKLDWMKKDGDPYSYYIADAYKNTGQTLFIIPVDDFLPDDYNSSEEIRLDEDSIGIVSGYNGVNSFVFSEKDGLIKKPELKNITEEGLMEELKNYSLWTKNAGDDFVSHTYFVYNLLGKKGYRYSTTLEIIEKLIKDGKIELSDKDKGGSKIRRIRIKENVPHKKELVKK